MTSLTKVK